MESLGLLGDYVLIERLGEGGMAEVFRAELRPGVRTSHPGGALMIKRIRQKLAEQPDFPIFREMFRNEARLVQRLSHPNLARVYALHEASDPQTGQPIPFIVGEYVRGSELWSLLRSATQGFRGKPVPPHIAAYIMREVARGLGHAHAHREGPRAAPIIHRDISPENILISDEGEIKLIDFGVAKALGGLGPQTRTGIIKGKLAYMAPEQVAQRPVPATDVFGAGIVLYEMLSGRRLFGGPKENDFVVVQRVLKGTIPPLPPAVPDALAQVVMRALQRDLQERYADGNTLAQAISEALRRTPSLKQVDAQALRSWVHQVQGRVSSVRALLFAGPRREQGSDLPVDLERAVREASGGGVSAEALFGALQGPIDPSVHAAMTMALKALTPPGAHAPEVRRERSTPVLRAPRLPTALLQTSAPNGTRTEPAVSRWALYGIAALLVIALGLFALLLRLRGWPAA